MIEKTLKPSVVAVPMPLNGSGEAMIDSVIRGKRYTQNIMVQPGYVLCVDVALNDLYVIPFELHNENDIIVIPQ